MSTIEEVRAAEKRLKDILQRLKSVGASDPDNLAQQLLEAADDYARLILELKSKSNDS